MKKLFIPLVAVLCLGLLVGCKTTTPATTKAFVKSTVTGIVAVGVNQAPEAGPYLGAAAHVVCEAAKGTNQSPQWVRDKLNENPASNAVKNETGASLINAVLGFYNGIYEAFGAEEVQDRPALQACLEGVCEGILAGLPTAQGVGVTARSKAKLPPHISTK